MLRLFWRAIVAVYICTGRKSLDQQPQVKQMEWNEVISKTLTSKFNELAHLPKLVYACYEADNVFGQDPLHLNTACGALQHMMKHGDWEYHSFER